MESMGFVYLSREAELKGTLSEMGQLDQKKLFTDGQSWHYINEKGDEKCLYEYFPRLLYPELAKESETLYFP